MNRKSTFKSLYEFHLCRQDHEQADKATQLHSHMTLYEKGRLIQEAERRTQSGAEHQENDS